MTLPELEHGLAMEYDMCFGVKVMSVAARGALAGAVEVVICIGSKVDGVICTEIVVGDEVGDGAGDGAVWVGHSH